MRYPLKWEANVQPKKVKTMSAIGIHQDVMIPVVVVSVIGYAIAASLSIRWKIFQESDVTALWPKIFAICAYGAAVPFAFLLWVEPVVGLWRSRLGVYDLNTLYWASIVTSGVAALSIAALFTIVANTIGWFLQALGASLIGAHRK